MHCPARLPAGRTFILTELPPVEHRGEAVTLALDLERARKTYVSGDPKRRGVCLDCGALVSGERKFCGMCAMQRAERSAGRATPEIAS